MTVSAPNHVANVVVITMASGRLRPASEKSDVLLIRVPAQTPRARVPQVEDDEEDQCGVHAWMVGFMGRAEV